MILTDGEKAIFASVFTQRLAELSALAKKIDADYMSGIASVSAPYGPYAFAEPWSIDSSFAVTQSIPQEAWVIQGALQEAMQIVAKSRSYANAISSFLSDPETIETLSSVFDIT